MLCFLSLEFSGAVGKTDHLPWQLMWCVKSWYLTPFRIPKRGIFWSVQRIRRSLVTVRWVIQNCYSNLFIIIIVFHFIRFYYFFGRGLRGEFYMFLFLCLFFFWGGRGYLDGFCQKFAFYETIECALNTNLTFEKRLRRIQKQLFF